jgi:hypothetical protein
MEERRKYLRYEVQYPLEAARSEEKGPITMLDVSKGGVSFSASRETKETEDLELQVFLKSRMFRLKATVVHVKHHEENRYDIGARFIEPPGEFEDLLEKEIKDITQVYRDANLYKRKGLTFLNASKEYLRRGKTPEKDESSLKILQDRQR